MTDHEVQRAARVGDAYLHARTGSVLVLARRKERGESGPPGWWTVGSGGVADVVLEADWRYLGPADVVIARHRARIEELNYAAQLAPCDKCLATHGPNENTRCEA